MIEQSEFVRFPSFVAYERRRSSNQEIQDGSDNRPLPRLIKKKPYVTIRSAVSAGLH